MNATSTFPKRLVSVLQLVRDLLSDPDRWTAHSCARSASGESVLSRSTEATCWDLSGAVLAQTNDNELAREIIRFLASIIDPDHDYSIHAHAPERAASTAASFNDNEGHRAVLDLLDRAIEAATSKAAA